MTNNSSHRLFSDRHPNNLRERSSYNYEGYRVAGCVAKFFVGYNSVASTRSSLALSHAFFFDVARQTSRAVKSLLHLADNLGGPSQRLNHLLALLPPAGGVVAFLEKLIQLISPVHVRHELLLHCLLGKPDDELEKTDSCVRELKMNILHKGEHDSLWNHVNHGPLDNIVVRGNEQLDNLNFHLLTL